MMQDDDFELAQYPDFMDSIPGFVLGRLLQGIGNGFLEVSGLALLMRYSTDLRRDIGYVWVEWMYVD